ncbi:MAG: GAF domain-containing protein [Balneolaceae bacterium]
MNIRREEKALLEFKHIMDDVVHLLRKSTGAGTVCFYWVNRVRKQFVLETNSTTMSNVMFQDRINFDNSFLDSFKEMGTVTQLKVGEDLDESELRHYYDFVPVKYLTLLPFVNNGETVAITVLETEEKLSIPECEEIFSAYRNALLNVLNTYLELTDLYESQQEWTNYENSLNLISPKLHRVEILDVMIEEMQKLLPGGGVSVVARGMESWITVLRSSKAPDTPVLGLTVEEKSMAYDALQKGEPLFSIHFNQNPRRLSTAEHGAEGATLAVPVLISDRRHAVILAYDKNPLVFSESTKHQLKNLVRTASLAIQVNLGKMSVHQDLFTSEYGSFIPDLWEKSLKKQIQKAGTSKEKTWFGFITLDNLPELRSRLRLEDLKQLQRMLVRILNPSRMGFTGFIGFNSDYVFSYLLTGHSENIHGEWKKNVEKIMEKEIELGDGQKIKTGIQIGSVLLDSPESEVHEVTTLAKKALSETVKENTTMD